MTNTDKIKQACIKANPEIVELKFGCVVKGHQFGVIIDNQTIRWEDAEIEDVEMGYLNNLEINLGIKIIGRPIRLADVLLATRNAAGTTDKWKQKTPKGKDWYEFINYAITLYWNLKDDNLDHQPEPTKKFIADLL